MNITQIFFGTDERVRSGWRFLIFVIAFFVSAIVFGGAAAAILIALGRTGTPVYFVVNGVISLILALVIGWLCGKYLEQLPFRALGASFTKGWLVNFVVGLILGILTLALAAGIGMLTGGLSFSFNTSADMSSIYWTLLISFLIFAAAAAFEEALFRGYILQTFVRSGLAWPAIIFISVFFGAVHLGNPSANAISSINTALAGIWLGIAYLKTRDLWLAFGLHLAWNWTQGSIFGIEVSGLTDIVKAPLMREMDSGPAWITGGDYGIEGGIITTIALIVSALVIYFMPLLKPDEELKNLSEPPAVQKPAR